jgi:predicted alpha/beta-fold hydrolase
LNKNNTNNLTERKNQIKSKIMIHGESLGGMVAAYVAMKSNSSY